MTVLPLTPPSEDDEEVLLLTATDCVRAAMAWAMLSFGLVGEVGENVVGDKGDLARAAAMDDSVVLDPARRSLSSITADPLLDEGAEISFLASLLLPKGKDNDAEAVVVVSAAAALTIFADEEAEEEEEGEEEAAGADPAGGRPCIFTPFAPPATAAFPAPPPVLLPLDNPPTRKPAADAASPPFVPIFFFSRKSDGAQPSLPSGSRTNHHPESLFSTVDAEGGDAAVEEAAAAGVAAAAADDDNPPAAALSV